MMTPKNNYQGRDAVGKFGEMHKYRAEIRQNHTVAPEYLNVRTIAIRTTGKKKHK